MIKRFKLSKKDYKQILAQIISVLEVEERAIIEIPIDDHEIINTVIRELREHDISTIYGENTEEIIRLIIEKRK